MCKCSIENCNNEASIKGLCTKHYTQIRRYGRTFEYSYRDKINHIEILEDHAEVYLIDRNNEVCGKALIDIEDIEKVKFIKWSRSDLQRSTYYAISNNKQWSKMHRLIMNVTDRDIVVDHINHNGLDNRKCNLKICTNSQNICNCKTPKNNKSGCKGVYWAKDKNKWTVQVSVNNKTKYIGRFTNYEDAVQARLEAEKQYYGEYAYNELKEFLDKSKNK